MSIPEFIFTTGAVTGGVIHIVGTPTTPGIYPFTITVTDPVGDFISKEYTITVAGITNGNALPNANVGTPYSTDVNSIGVTNPIFSVESGSLPDGLNLDPGGIISGTPTTSGTFDFTLGVTEAGTGVTCNAPGEIIVKPPLFSWSNLVWGAPTLVTGCPGSTAAASGTGGTFDSKSTNPNSCGGPSSSAIIIGTMSYNGPDVSSSNLAVTYNVNPANGGVAFMVAQVTVTSAQHGNLLTVNNQAAGSYNFPFNVPATSGPDTLTVRIATSANNGFNNIIAEVSGTLTP